MSRLVDLTGQRFGRWTVLSRAENDHLGRSRWHVECDCGSVDIRSSNTLRTGNSQSCGCFRIDQIKKANTTHGHTVGEKTPEYKSWAHMLNRCRNPRDPQFSDYGGRGIVVCERWLQFENFLADMGLRPEGGSIERVNNEGDYCPANCKWATQKEQQANKRSSRPITFRGVTQSIESWAAELGLSYEGMVYRLNTMPLEQALTMPIVEHQVRKR